MTILGRSKLHVLGMTIALGSTLLAATASARLITGTGTEPWFIPDLDATGQFDNTFVGADSDKLFKNTTTGIIVEIVQARPTNLSGAPQVFRNQCLSVEDPESPGDLYTSTSDLQIYTRGVSPSQVCRFRMTLVYNPALVP